MQWFQVLRIKQWFCPSWGQTLSWPSYESVVFRDKAQVWAQVWDQVLVCFTTFRQFESCHRFQRSFGSDVFFRN